MKKPRILDLFCGAGGAAMGYSRAGFDVVGVDIAPQKHYPFEFHQADALEYLAEHGREFDVIHASPPCQHYSEMTEKRFRDNHPDLIDVTRLALIEMDRPWVIENVEGAKHVLGANLLLCGSMFGLKVWRHRLFRTSFSPPLTNPCDHSFLPVLITGTTRRKTGRFEYNAQECRDASGLDWMTRKEMDEAIPPAFTEFIGHYLMEYLERASAA